MEDANAARDTESNTEKLIDRYCAVWSQPDAAERERLLGEVWAERATYTDPTVHTDTPQALLAHIAGVHAQYPGMRVERTSRVDCHHGLARFHWRAVPADGVSLPEGVDFVRLSADGERLLSVAGFFGPLSRR